MALFHRFLDLSGGGKRAGKGSLGEEIQHEAVELIRKLLVDVVLPLLRGKSHKHHRISNDLYPQASSLPTFRGNSIQFNRMQRQTEQVCIL